MPLGVDPASADLSGLRYDKICILADADSDGAHIATLLCALFLRHYRPLVDTGHVYIAMPPLYRVDVGKEVFYALDEAEKEGILDRIAAEKKRGAVNVQRFKGLGEMNPIQLRETTMDPDTRRLVQLTLAAPDETLEMMDMLLAKKRARRPARVARDERRPGKHRLILSGIRDMHNYDDHESGETEQVPLKTFTEKAYLDYSMYVINDRALPHIGDGLKPVQRRIVYAMSQLESRLRREVHEVGADDRRRARQVPSARRLGLLRSDGADGAAVLVSLSAGRRTRQLGRARRSEVVRGDALHRSAAVAIRRTAAGGSRPGHGRLRRRTSMRTLTEPSLLPARVPFVLLNGSTGIAVGMATDIPPHNISEV